MTRGESLTHMLTAMQVSFGFGNAFFVSLICLSVRLIFRFTVRLPPSILSPVSFSTTCIPDNPGAGAKASCRVCYATSCQSAQPTSMAAMRLMQGDFYSEVQASVQHISAHMSPAYCLGLWLLGDLGAADFFALSAAELGGAMIGMLRMRHALQLATPLQLWQYSESLVHRGFSWHLLGNRCWWGINVVDTTLSSG